MKKVFVGNLPSDTTEEDILALFSQHGRVRSLKLNTDVFTGACRGFGFVEMEGHEARAAIAGLNGKTFKGRPLRVNMEEPRNARHRGRR
ncbi:MAG: RNA-binding protein [Gammaproteobacteria bacterium]